MRFFIACFVVQMYEYLFLENKSKDIVIEKQKAIVNLLFILFSIH